MRAKLTNSLLPTRTSPFALALVCSLITSFTSSATAQEIDFQSSIDSTSEALAALDVMASDCFAALNSEADAKAHCDDFIDAIDGELMANYLRQCRALKSWRDEYVAQTVAADRDSDSDNNEEMLRRLVSIEFTCGENALRNRTQFVFSAFNRLQRTAAPGGANGRSINRQLSQNRFNALDNAERRRLQDALQNQQRRSLRESERQFDALENELIRQQIQNSNLPN